MILRAHTVKVHQDEGHMLAPSILSETATSNQPDISSHLAKL